MKCEFCEGETTHRKVRKQHWLKGKLYIVENVDAEVCAKCGERYFHASTLDGIDKALRVQLKSQKKLRSLKGRIAWQGDLEKMRRE